MIEFIQPQSAFKDRVYERYLKDRIIIINEDITEDVMEKVIMPILKWNNIDDKKEDSKDSFERNTDDNAIKLYINSYGGSVYDGLSLISTIEGSKTPVHTYANGKAMSMGFTILCAGSKRFMQKYSTLMYHEVSQFLSYATCVTHKHSIEEGERLNKVIDNIIINQTGITQEMLDKAKNEHPHDWYIGAEEALKLGIAHELF